MYHILFDSARRRSNAVVKQSGDTFRDTMVLTVRGDGVDLPPFFILTKFKTASRASGRRPLPGELVDKGMTIVFMMKYIDFISDYVREPSVLLMDRHSSHTSKTVINYIKSFKLKDGRQMFHPKLLGPKTAFLISPLDMGAIAAMKTEYYKLDRSTLELKKCAAMQAWKAVSNDAIRGFFRNCGLVGKEKLSTIRTRFTKQVRGGIPLKLEKLKNFYDLWASGAVAVEGSTRTRQPPLESPQQLRDSDLDGAYWCYYGPH